MSDAGHKLQQGFPDVQGLPLRLIQSEDLIDAEPCLLVDGRHEGREVAGQRAVDDMLMVRVPEDDGVDEAVVPVEAVVVGGGRGEDVVGLVEHPAHLRARDGHLGRRAQQARDDKGIAALAVLVVAALDPVPDLSEGGEPALALADPGDLGRIARGAEPCEHEREERGGEEDSRHVRRGEQLDGAVSGDHAENRYGAIVLILSECVCDRERNG